MPYTYQGWTLYSRDVKLKKGPKVTIYFFSKRKPKSGKPMDEMPPAFRSCERAESALATPYAEATRGRPSALSFFRARVPFDQDRVR